jgi:hypothetical protein
MGTRPHPTPLLAVPRPGHAFRYKDGVGMGLAPGVGISMGLAWGGMGLAWAAWGRMGMDLQGPWRQAQAAAGAAGAGDAALS